MPEPISSQPASPKPAPRAATNVKDLTQPAEIVHKLSYTAEEVPAFLASIDPEAPAGKLARVFSAHIGPKGEISFSIYYKA